LVPSIHSVVSTRIVEQSAITRGKRTLGALRAAKWAVIFSIAAASRRKSSSASTI